LRQQRILLALHCRDLAEQQFEPIQLAWLWVRHQPQSALTQWFKAHSQRGRKRAIVALARKLLVALWKYVTAGVVIEGAVMKTA